MSANTGHVRNGFSCVRPYIFGPLSLADFVKRVFNAEELARYPVGKGFHIESKIGDSVVVMEVCDPPHPSGRPNSIYVYVEDVDAAYGRALEAGAKTIHEPQDQTYAERNAGVRDAFDNIWYIATYTGKE